MKAWPGSRVALASTAATMLSQLACGDRVLADDRGRRLLAAADAGRGDDAHPGPEELRQPGQQIAGAGDLARQAVADANGQRRGRRRLP
jgi:hypothetical protein